MSLAIIHSRALHGMQCPAVTVEVHLANGLPAFSIVGLAEQAVKESKDRVRGALQTCGFDFPNRRITVNLAPADLPKEGSRFDLPIALGILAAADQIPDNNLDTMEFIGELALSGARRTARRAGGGQQRPLVAGTTGQPGRGRAGRRQPGARRRTPAVGLPAPARQRPLGPRRTRASTRSARPMASGLCRGLRPATGEESAGDRRGRWP